MTPARSLRPYRSSDGVIVARQEIRDLWLGGRGLALTLGFSVLLSVISYLVATNQALNYLEQRETVNLTLQVAIAVGALLALLAAANAISGERERGSLESLLVTPVSRSGLAAGKLVAALTLWLAAYVVTVPYVWFLGRDVGAVGDALLTGAVVGTLLAVFLAALGIVISIASDSNRLSLSVSLFVLLALYAPGQLPSGAQKGWFGEMLVRVNPMTAGSHVVDRIVISGSSWGDQLPWLAAPVVGALIGVAAVLVAAQRMRLHGKGTG